MGVSDLMFDEEGRGERFLHAAAILYELAS
jgi:hypothetical protein